MYEPRDESPSHPVIYLAFWIIGLLILGMQALEYIETGAWHAISIIEFVDIITEADDVADLEPASLLRSVFDAFPASLVFFGAGLAVFLGGGRRRSRS